MKEKTEPLKIRKYMLPYLDDHKKVHFLLLHADNYKDAVKIASCVIQDPTKSLCYKDFTIRD